MASSNTSQALDQLPIRPCKGSGATFPLQANYSTLTLPQLVVHRYAITIVQLNKDRVEQAGQQAVQKQTDPAKVAPQKSAMPGPVKPSTPVKQNPAQARQPPTGKQKAPVAGPANRPPNPWNTTTTTLAERLASPAGAPSKAITSAPVRNPALSAAIPSRPAAAGSATTATSSDAAAATPETDDGQNKGGPTGKKAEQVIKLFLDLSALQKFKKGIFTDFRALLFSTQELPPHALSQVVRYRAEHNDTVTPNALEYLVKLDHTAQFDIASLTARPGARNPQLDVVAKQDMIQALNILFLHYGRSSPKRLSVGSRRSFPSEISSQGQDIGEGILAMRGYFSSVHVVDYRILVNVNVSHGSFYETNSLLKLMGKIDRNFKSRPGALLSILKGIRIGQTHFTDPSGNLIPPKKRTKTIIGFATGADGRFPQGKQPNNYKPPIVPRPFAGPEEVKFWYEEQAESSGSTQRGKFISVADYFRKCTRSLLQVASLLTFYRLS